MKNQLIKKGLALLLLISLSLSLTACGGENVSTEPSASGAAGSSAVPPETMIRPTEPDILPTEPAVPASQPDGPAIIGKAEAADLMEDFTAETVPGRKIDEAFRLNLLRFSAEIFREVYDRDAGNKTTLVSPLSILNALAMTANGAREETLKEMEAVLAGADLTLDDLNAYLHTYLNALPSSENASFAFANSIWFRDTAAFTVERDFLQKNVNYYSAGIYKAPFDETTVRDINQWVETNTHGMIPKILDSLSAEDMMMLINALVFEAKWASPFPNHVIQEELFTCLDGTQIPVFQMYGTEHCFLSDDTCTGFMKDYKEGYRFVALLPNEGVDLDSFIASLSAEKLNGLLTKQQGIKTYIKLPKFSYDFSQALNEALEALGMERAFSGAAQFEGISRDLPLAIAGVVHMTHIDVDNEGTRAAAVTAVTMAATAMPGPEETREVWLDRPFVYMIIDSVNNLPIFIGSVTEPGE